MINATIRHVSRFMPLFSLPEAWNPAGYLLAVVGPLLAELGSQHLLLPSSADNQAKERQRENERPGSVNQEAAERRGDDSNVHRVAHDGVGPVGDQLLISIKLCTERA